ncbi:MAG: hypothetical protein Q9227_009203 [Pyrenula ochraceoflavens]
MRAFEPQKSRFNRFYAETAGLCDAFLSYVQSLHPVYDVEHNFKVSDSLNHLQETIDRIREFYGIEYYNQRQNQPMSDLQLELENAEQKIKEHEHEMNECQDEINEYRNKLNISDNKLREYKNRSNESNATVQNLREKLASKYEETKDFDSAAQQYRDLSKNKAQEREMWSQKVPLTDGSLRKARTAESAELEFILKYGKMLVKKENYPQAEATFDDLLERRKRYYNDRDVRCWQIQEVQSELCKVLRLQGTETGLVKAEELYYKAGFLENITSKNDVDRTWAVRNAFDLACVKAEQGRYDRAIDQLGYVWPYRHHASDDCIKEMNSGVINLLESFEKQGKSPNAESVLQIICKGNEALLPQLMRDLIAFGQRLHNDGKSKQAVKYLRTAWMATPTQSSPVRAEERLSYGWAYVLNLYYVGHPVPESDLKSMLKLCSTQTNPNKFHIKALLAHSQLNAKNFSLAKQTAQEVYNQYKTTTILPFQGYHHADTLIRAIAMEEFYDGKWTKAETIWKEVFEKARKLPLGSGNGHNKHQLEYHAETGLLLAKQWNLRRKSRGQTASPRANTIKKEAEKLKALAV